MFASRHSHHGIPIKGHFHRCTPTKGHLHHGIPTKRHLHHGIPTRGHLHHDIPTKSICIMTYLLEDICTTRFLHLHLCKETFASRVNTCAGTIMDKRCICTITWDVCIMKIAPLKGDMCIIWTFRICILVKSICIEKEKSRLA